MIIKLGLLHAGRINNREWLPYDTNNLSLACAVPKTGPRLLGTGAERRCLFSGKYALI